MPAKARPSSLAYFAGRREAIVSRFSRRSSPVAERNAKQSRCYPEFGRRESSSSPATLLLDTASRESRMFSSGNAMSCVDVMYQPYATYFPYHHHHHHHQRSATSVHGSLDAIKFGVSKLQDPLDTSPLTFQTGLAPSSVGNSLSHGSPATGGAAATGSSTPLSIQTKEEGDADKSDTPHATQYLSSNCVLVTYFSGDISANVDEHFTRALSQPSSYNTDSQGTKTANWKETSPMSQRNFPPSFWNSSYQPPPSGALSASSHQDLPGFTADPYGHMTSSLHGMHGSLHNDPWRYPLTTQAYTHHGVPDLAGYSSAAMAASSGRFNAHYGSLLPGARFGAMTSQCDPLSKHTDTWTSRYAHTDLGTNIPPHPDSMASLHGILGGGIETAVQDSKDLYWF